MPQLKPFLFWPKKERSPLGSTWLIYNLNMTKFKNQTRLFSSTAYFRTDESSNDDMPDLIKSRSIGKWDSSTVPDTISQPDEDTFDRNKYSRDLADNVRTFHEDREKFNKECLKVSDYVTSESGRMVRDIDTDDVKKMATAVNNAEKDAQNTYDTYHNEIITVYGIVREGINTDRRAELSLLEDRRVLFNENVDDEKEKEAIVAKYNEEKKAI